MKSPDQIWPRLIKDRAPVRDRYTAVQLKSIALASTSHNTNGKKTQQMNLSTLSTVYLLVQCHNRR